MSEQLPPPNPSQFPHPVTPYLRIVPAGTRIARAFFVAGEHPVAWNDMRSFGPTGSRFDHHPDGTPQVHPGYGVSYGALEFDGCPHLMRTALAEMYSSGENPRKIMLENQPAFCTFRTVRDLRLLDLADSDWLTHSGGNAAIASGNRARAREWAREIYAAYADVDGVVYRSSNDTRGQVVALWERAADAFPVNPEVQARLHDPVLIASTTKYAVELHLPMERPGA